MATMWFGNKQKFQAVPVPSTGMQANRVGFAESGTLENGGGYGSRSTGKHREYSMDFGAREAAGLGNLDVFSEYATGQWDEYSSLLSPSENPNNLIWFADPMIFDQNLFPPHWASPALFSQGDWHPITRLSLPDPLYVTPTNSYGHPKLSAVFNNYAGAPTTRAKFRNMVTIPIPPGYNLYWGYSSHYAGGTFGPIAGNTATGATSAHLVSPYLPLDQSKRLNTTPVSGSTYDHATFQFAPSGGEPMTSMMAQLWPIGVTPNLDGGQGGRHIPGMGNTGCVFSDAATTESYVIVDRERNKPVHYKGLSTSLIEVGGWK